VFLDYLTRMKCVWAMNCSHYNTLMRSDDDSIVLSLSMWFFHVKMDKIVKAPDEVATVEVAGMLTGIFATA